ncbi:MAG: Major Facilitator Superfamily protein [Lentisphaerae bacterium ADurb.Bin242]|nr:MAG: Major Facilitator Superfamily protein [Lentisphaerae bacterium ADurb.Bin242]
MNSIRNLLSRFKSKSGADAFFTSILFWGCAAGCFVGVLNNYLADGGMNEFQRGVLEFFREMPGLLLVFILALMHKKTEVKILRLGTLIAILGVAGLLLSPDKAFITLLIMVWSTGEHILMPVRATIAMHIAKRGSGGASLGYVTGVMNAGQVTGSLLTAAVFFAGLQWFGVVNKLLLYNIVWGLICLLTAVSFFFTLGCRDTGEAVRRPRLYFRRKYMKFYLLELFHGARKQIFLTFAPYVLILIYHRDTAFMATLAAVCAGVNIVCAPLIGKLTDRFGYRNVMIYDTVLLFFVCIFYGFAGSWFSPAVAGIVVCANYLLDAVLSNASLASNLYVRAISNSNEEVTSTITTGISINHLISILAALAGGWVWQKFGVSMLFVFAALMAIGNLLLAVTVPKEAGK